MFSNKKRAQSQYSELRSYKMDMYAYSFTMVLPAIVTPPICVRSLPLMDAPVFNVMDCIAIMVPFITDVVPKVAELPTCQ